MDEEQAYTEGVILQLNGESKADSQQDTWELEVKDPTVWQPQVSYTGGDRDGRLAKEALLAEEGQVNLMYSQNQKLPMKDFHSEVRAYMDVQNFLKTAVIQLDVEATNTAELLRGLLTPVLAQEGVHDLLDMAVAECFSQDSGHKLAKTIQGTMSTPGGGFDYDQTWVTILCSLPTIQRRYVAIGRLNTHVNLGRTCQEASFVILVVAPTKEKNTKTALETGRTFATLFCDSELRYRLLSSKSEQDFTHVIHTRCQELTETKEHVISNGSLVMKPSKPVVDPDEKETCCFLGRGIYKDLKRRIPFYMSDYKDGIFGHKTLQKTASTTAFLYFAILLPSIALGMLNDKNTHGKLDVRKVLYTQTIGGLVFALLGGQPMTILMTTAPLALYTKVIYTICDQWDLNFFAMYAWTGIWNTIFLIIYSLVDASRLMKWSTRSTEEIFALFIAVAFFTDSFKDVRHNFDVYYHSPACKDHSSGNTSNLVNLTQGVIATVASGNNTTAATEEVHHVVQSCFRDTSLLFLILTLGTLWLGVTLFNFTKTPFLTAGKRELLADYALPTAVIVMSFFGSYVFREVQMDSFNVSIGSVFSPAPLGSLSTGGIFGAMGLGLCLSFLFFMDQNISSAMVNSPEHKLKKGQAYSWDLLVVALLNGVLAFLGLPMIHGALPHSPLHVRVMAESEDYVEQGHVYQRILRARETRITGVVTHILIGVSLFLLPYPLAFIPRPVLDGLFLYLAVTSLNNNQMFERMLLLVTEQAAYPPTHYIRKVPQRKIHLFTLSQVIQLGIMCGFGFSPFPYLKMCFPILLLLMLPVRHKLVTRVVEKRHIDAIDGH